MPLLGINRSASESESTVVQAHLCPSSVLAMLYMQIMHQDNCACEKSNTHLSVRECITRNGQ